VLPCLLLRYLADFWGLSRCSDIPEGPRDTTDPKLKISPVLTSNTKYRDLERHIRTYEEEDPAKPGKPGELKGFERYVADTCRSFIDAGLKVKLARKTPKTKEEGLTVLLLSVPDETFQTVLGALEFDRFVTSGRGATISENVTAPVRTDFEPEGREVGLLNQGPGGPSGSLSYPLCVAFACDLMEVTATLADLGVITPGTKRPGITRWTSISTWKAVATASGPHRKQGTTKHSCFRPS
jgi:hypothetical protein